MSPFLTPREVADMAKLSPHAVYRAIKRGDLEATEPVPGRLRIAAAEFERWMATPRRTRSVEQAVPRERRRAANQGSFAAELRAADNERSRMGCYRTGLLARSDASKPANGGPGGPSEDPMTSHEVVPVNDLEAGDRIKVQFPRSGTQMWKITRIEEFPKMRSLLLVKGPGWPTCTYKHRKTLVYREAR